MDIIIVYDYAHINGGAALIAIQSALGLADRGNKVTYFSAVSPIDSQLSEHPNIDVICLEQEEILKNESRFAAAVSGIYNKHAGAEFQQLLQQFNPQKTLVHFHGWTKALSAILIKFANEMGFKTIVTLHEFFTACPNGGFMDYQKLEICNRKPLSWDCISCNCDARSYSHKLWRTLRQATHHFWKTNQRVSCFIGVSDFATDILRPYLPQNTPIKIVKNICTVKKAPPVKIDKNSPFLFIGRFSAEKGVLLLAEAASRGNFPVKFIGDGEMRDEAEKICPNAEFTGWLSRDAVVENIRSSRALVFPSTWYETFGLTPLEALACGIPVIVSDCTAATDYLQEGVTGHTFKSGDVESLYAVMDRYQDETILDKLGSNAYQWYWDNPWTAEAHIDALVQIYESLLKQEKCI